MRPVALLLVLVVAGCASVSGQMLDDAAQRQDATYFVENHGRDGRHIEVMIAGALQRRGLSVTSGGRGERPEGVDYVVTYVDRWQWDMRTYLMDLRIQIRDANSGSIVGEGHSYQPSLSAMGMSFQDVVERTVDQFMGASEQ